MMPASHSPQVECILQCSDALGELPLWDALQQRLWWIDVRAPLLQVWDPSTNAHQRFALPGKSVGSWAFRRGGGMIVSLHDGIYAFEPQTRASQRLLPLEADREGHRLNDGRCDANGRFWIGTMHDTVRAHQGSFYRVTPDLRVESQFDAVDIPNSVVFSPDNTVMYFADSTAKKIWAFDFDLDAGRLSNRRVFADCSADPGVPDGSAIDVDGCLWNANYGNSRLVRYTPAGKVDRVIPLPVTQPTCCTFGGANLDTLYITTARQKLSAEQLAPQPLAGALFALATNTQGMPEPAFAG